MWRCVAVQGILKLRGKGGLEGLTLGENLLLRARGLVGVELEARKAGCGASWVYPVGRIAVRFAPSVFLPIQIVEVTRRGSEE